MSDTQTQPTSAEPAIKPPYVLKFAQPDPTDLRRKLLDQWRDTGKRRETAFEALHAASQADGKANPADLDRFMGLCLAGDYSFLLAAILRRAGQYRAMDAEAEPEPFVDFLARVIGLVLDTGLDWLEDANDDLIPADDEDELIEREIEARAGAVQHEIDSADSELPTAQEIELAEQRGSEGFRVGGLVTIVARDEQAPGGRGLIGRTGEVAAIDDDDPEFPVGIEVDGFDGLAWCALDEIRHAAADAQAERDVAAAVNLVPTDPGRVAAATAELDAEFPDGPAFRASGDCGSCEGTGLNIGLPGNCPACNGTGDTQTAEVAR